MTPVFFGCPSSLSAIQPFVICIHKPQGPCSKSKKVWVQNVTHKTQMNVGIFPKQAHCDGTEGNMLSNWCIYHLGLESSHFLDLWYLYVPAKSETLRIRGTVIKNEIHTISCSRSSLFRLCTFLLYCTSPLSRFLVGARAQRFLAEFDVAGQHIREGYRIWQIKH